MHTAGKPAAVEPGAALWALAVWPLVALAATPLVEAAFGPGLGGKAAEIALQAVAPLAAFADAAAVHARRPRFATSTWLWALVVGPVYIGKRCRATGVEPGFARASWAMFAVATLGVAASVALRA